MKRAEHDRQGRNCRHRRWLLPAALAVFGSVACGQVTPAAAPTANGAAPTAISRWAPDWMTIGVEIRGRAELYTGLGFVPDTQDGYHLHRLRINTTLRMRPWLRTFVQLQDSQVPGYSRGVRPSSMANTLDVR